MYGLSNRKNDLVLAKIAAGGVQVYDGRSPTSRRCGTRASPRAVVSASANTKQVLDSAGIAGLFDVRIDGVVAKERACGQAGAGYLPGRGRGAWRARRARGVFEDAQAGVAAGHAGHFALVVGVDRVGQAAELREHGADIVVKDLAELLEPGAHPGQDAR